MLDAREIDRGLRYCADRLPRHEEIVCSGCGALVMFHGYREQTEDIDAFHTPEDEPAISDELFACAREYAGKTDGDVISRWLNSDIVGVTYPFVFSEYQKHIDYDIEPIRYHNADGESRITLRPVRLEFIYKAKVLMDRPKDRVQLKYIDRLLGMSDYNTALAIILAEDPSFGEHPLFDLFCFLLKGNLESAI